jgi:shikimate kinase
LAVPAGPGVLDGDGKVPAMCKVLVTGMSGTGKSSVLRELAQRGYQTVDTDSDEWSEWASSDADAGSSDWIWREDRITKLLENHPGGVLYVSGCKSNQGKFYDRFDAVVLLSAPAETILERISTRDTNDYGKRPHERQQILYHLETIEPLLRSSATVELDASRQLSVVTDDLVGVGEALANVGLASRRSGRKPLV